MADETTDTGTAQETGTALEGQESTPNTEGADTAKTPAAKPIDFEKELQRVRTEAGRRAAEAERKAAELAAQVRNLQMRDMTDVEKLQFERDEAIRYANAAHAEVEAERDLRARVERLSELSRRTNVPFEELNKAQTPDEMALVVHEWNQKLSAKQVDEAVEKSVERKSANKVVVSGGSPSTTTTRHEKALQDAQQAGDAVAYIRLLREGPK